MTWPGASFCPDHGGYGRRGSLFCEQCRYLEALARRNGKEAEGSKRGAAAVKRAPPLDWLRAKLERERGLHKKRGRLLAVVAEAAGASTRTIQRTLKAHSIDLDDYL